jgi:hypothetical protein
MSRDAGKRAAANAGRFFPVLCSFFVACAGCQPSNAYLEAELRLRERELREVREQLYWQQTLNPANPPLPVVAPPPGAVSMYPPKPAAQPPQVREILLGRMTGGRDEDKKPGDEALQVIVEPRDTDGKPVKAPATVHVGALLVGPDGQERSLCAWEIDPETLRQSWRYSLLSTGYHLVLPWKTRPETERLRIVVQLILASGRVLEADRVVMIQVPPPDQRKKPKKTAAPKTTPRAPRTAEKPSDNLVRIPPAVKPAPVAQAVHKKKDEPKVYLSDFVTLGKPEPLYNRFLGHR